MLTYLIYFHIAKQLATPLASLLFCEHYLRINKARTVVTLLPKLRRSLTPVRDTNPKKNTGENTCLKLIFLKHLKM